MGIDSNGCWMGNWCQDKGMGGCPEPSGSGEFCLLVSLFVCLLINLFVGKFVCFFVLLVSGPIGQ